MILLEVEPTLSHLCAVSTPLDIEAQQTQLRGSLPLALWSPSLCLQFALATFLEMKHELLLCAATCGNGGKAANGNCNCASGSVGAVDASNNFVCLNGEPQPVTSDL